MQTEQATVRPVYTGGLRWLIAAVVVLGPLLQVVEFLLGGPAGDDNAARVAYWQTHLAQIDLSMAAGLLAVPFLLGGAYVIVALSQHWTHQLAMLAGALMTVAMVGLGALHGYELAAYVLAQAGNAPAAVIALNGAEPPGWASLLLFLMFLGGAVLGTLTLVVVAWRSPLVPRLVPIFMLAFLVLDLPLGQAILAHLANLAGFAILAWAVVAGYTRKPGRFM